MSPKVPDNVADDDSQYGTASLRSWPEGAEPRPDEKFIPDRDKDRRDTKGQAQNLITMAAPEINQADASRWIGREPDPLVFTVDRLIPQGMVTLLVADGGAGKSMLCQTAMTCIATGRDFLGYHTRRGAAAGVFAEDPENVLHLRQEHINGALGIEMDDLAELCFPASYAGLDAVLWRDSKPTPLLTELDDQLARIPDLRLLVIDTAALVFAGGENDRVDVTQFISRLTRLAMGRHIGVLLSAHTSKTSSDSLVNAGSGSTAWPWACRSVLKLTRNDDKDKASLKLLKANHTKPGDAIELHWKDTVLLRAPILGSVERSIRQSQLDKIIFERVQEAWASGSPLSPNWQARSRYLPAIIARQPTNDFKKDEIQVAMDAWMDSGHLVMDQKKNKAPRGLRVGKWPESLDQPSQGEDEQRS